MIPSSELPRAKRLGREPVQTIEMDQAKIDETVEKYGNAAKRMKRAGMDKACEMRHVASETEIRIVGDCKKLGEDISGAVNGGFQAALHI